MAAKGLVNNLEQLDDADRGRKGEEAACRGLSDVLDRWRRGALGRRLAVGDDPPVVPRSPRRAGSWPSSAARRSPPRSGRTRPRPSTSAATSGRRARARARYSMPRIDRHGYPLRPSDGEADRQSRPAHRRGRLSDRRRRASAWSGSTAQPLERGPRTRICEDWVTERYGLDVVTQGSWYRCCNGQIRKLVDCCSRRRRTGSTATASLTRLLLLAADECSASCTTTPGLSC